MCGSLVHTGGVKPEERPGIRVGTDCVGVVGVVVGRKKWRWAEGEADSGGRAERAAATGSLPDHPPLTLEWAANANESSLLLIEGEGVSAEH